MSSFLVECAWLLICETVGRGRPVRGWGVLAGQATRQAHTTSSTSTASTHSQHSSDTSLTDKVQVAFHLVYDQTL